ncbi:MAG: zf-HC2 domain-containing protein [Actinomycetota bacterium]
MIHDPERDAATFLGGEMPPKRAAAFERHLLECEDCWREVSEGRRGRALAESARELASQQLREDVRAAVAAFSPEPARRTRRWLAAAAAVFVIAAGTSTFLVVRDPSQPEAIAAAVADFRTGRLPVAQPATRTAPDLTSAGLVYVDGGSGRIGEFRIDAFAYRDRAGNGVLLYLSDEPFPVAAGADRSSDTWTASDGEVALLCAEHPHALLLLGRDADVLERAANALGAV